MIESATDSSWSASDTIAAISAGVAVIACIASIIFANISKKSAKDSTDISRSALAASHRAAIASARKAYSDILVANHRDIEAKAISGILAKTIKAAVEDYLNAHESAAWDYVHERLDSETYKKLSKSEIDNFCTKQSTAVEKYLFPRASSKFQGIWKAHDKANMKS